jgi:hypothetical protein
VQSSTVALVLAAVLAAGPLVQRAYAQDVERMPSPDGTR